MNELTGKLVYVFVVSIIDAALLAWLALRWYRHSVRRLMSTRGAAVVPASPPAEARKRPVPATPPREPDGFQLAEEQGDAAAEWPFARRAASRRVIVAYCLGAAAYASIITTLKFLPESPLLPAVAWLVDWWTQTWPILPTLIALLVLDRPLILRLALLYIGGGLSSSPSSRQAASS